jgi:hypothetical protein
MNCRRVLALVSMTHSITILPIEFLTAIEILSVFLEKFEQGGWCVITKNLFSIARYQARRRGHGQVG